MHFRNKNFSATASTLRNSPRHSLRACKVSSGDTLKYHDIVLNRFECINQSAGLVNLNENTNLMH